MHEEPEYIVIHKQHGQGATDQLWEFLCRGDGDTVQGWLYKRDCSPNHYHIFSIAHEHEVVDEPSIVLRRFGVRVQ